VNSTALLNRRRFLQLSCAASGTLLGHHHPWSSLAAEPAGPQPLRAEDLPKGSAPPALDLPHFPSRVHAFVWRNWPLVPTARMAAVLGAPRVQVERLAAAMGLGKPPKISADQQRRSYLTVIRRNWHLLPYPQLLQLLNWTPQQLAYTLREDDFFFIKLGSLKPEVPPLRWPAGDAATEAQERAIADLLHERFPGGLAAEDPLFSFVSRLSSLPKERVHPAPASAPLRYCYSYFALYGDPLLEPEVDPYPEGYLARLAATGVTGVWLQAVLHKLAPFPWNPALSDHWQTRLENLAKLVARARRQGIRVFLYLNEPRAMPLRFFAALPQLKGVVEGDYAALCTSVPAVQQFLVEAVATVCRAVPDLGGFFTISGSENLTNCWSHHSGAGCPRCGQRSPAAVIAEVNALFAQGIQAARPAQPRPELIVWDWGWNDAWVEEIVRRLPAEAALMSVSEWSLPIERGGVKNTVGEYSISSIGPGPRAQRHWAFAQARGLKTVAKIQAGNTWELSSVPYIPALVNVAQHAVNLRARKVESLMLSWTLGGYPSPNLEAVKEASECGSVDLALQRVAERRFGTVLGPPVVAAWREFSAAFAEFPYDGGVVYQAPLQMGPANLLWAQPTGYHATMTGLPYDDLAGWRSLYPPPVFAGQLEKVAGGFERGVAQLRGATQNLLPSASKTEARELAQELSVAEAAAIHFRSSANQVRFVLARDALKVARNAEEARPLIASLQELLTQEQTLASRLHFLQTRDSRLGFEAANQYFYVPADLAEKVLNCQDLLHRWLPGERRRWGL
jgi:hypothetical protein